jgi:CRISPR-associated protein Csx3
MMREAEIIFSTLHYYNPTKFIATHDPRLGGAVIIESHSRAHTVGTVIKEVDL